MRIKIFLLACLLTGSVSAFSPLEDYESSGFSINSSYHDFWTGNYGDVLDLRIQKNPDLPPQARNIIVLELKKANRELNNQNIPYMEKEKSIKREIQFLTESLPRLRNELTDFYRERNLLRFKSAADKGQTDVIDSINVNREKIYALEQSISSMETKLHTLRHNLENVKRYLSVNNLLIRRNNLRIAFWGTEEKNIQFSMPVISSHDKASIFNDHTPLLDPHTLPAYSLAAMDGFRLEYCPVHETKLDYSFQMVEESYRGIPFSFPLYAGWCNRTNTAYLFRDIEDNSKKVVIEVRNEKKRRIDEMLRNS